MTPSRVYCPLTSVNWNDRNKREVQKALNHYVKHKLPQEHGITPHLSDRASYPMPRNIKKIMWEMPSLCWNCQRESPPQNFYMMIPNLSIYLGRIWVKVAVVMNGYSMMVSIRKSWSNSVASSVLSPFL